MPSKRFPHNSWSYEACATPPLGSHLCPTYGHREETNTPLNTPSSVSDVSSISQEIPEILPGVTMEQPSLLEILTGAGLDLEENAIADIDSIGDARIAINANRGKLDKIYHSKI